MQPFKNTVLYYLDEQVCGNWKKTLKTCLLKDKDFEADYRVGQTIGQGSFGKVKLAIHRKSGAYVAVKKI